MVSILTLDNKNSEVQHALQYHRYNEITGRLQKSRLSFGNIVTRCVIPEREMAFALSFAQVFSSRPFCESDYAQPARWRGPFLSCVDYIVCALPVLGSEIHRQICH